MIYLDNAATTPLYPEVKEHMVEHINSDSFGNPSSVHRAGRKGKALLEDARELIANTINATPGEIIFTGSGTESINSAIIGTAYANILRGKHIITSAVEHHAVLNTCEYLEQQGWDVTYLPVDSKGWVNPQHVLEAIRKDTILVSIMYVNNEVGTIQAIEEIARVTSRYNITLHSDMVQAYGKLKIDVKSLPVDLISVSAHKIHGPKGVGLLYIKQKLAWSPYIFGGKQERGRRAGTENMPGILGFAKAAEITYNKLDATSRYLQGLKDTFINVLNTHLDSSKYTLNEADKVIPSILNISFKGIDAESLLIALDLASIACSHGSACTSGSLEPSHVLEAMGLDKESIQGALRFSFSELNNREEIETAALTVANLVKKMQK
ncbi:cysteine desulfurase family protein [Desulfuribacillus alkaliarsenatis]|uniref:cysteine desulfurase n=1 Tax=Desulfuribacillus alkaliarsenatis TaxID=766136 RepID=A0A1E5G0F5_9FIRM|nr:cysteine desulfurase family protein [Desulfuribacillus alkaliarsenatis]OEF96316.1 hypothetical protein BHF68_09155 [Desulfuribacillus alkaliarsenatis]